MTDADAKQRIQGTIDGLVEAKGMAWPEHLRERYASAVALDAEALRHALQALEDREALVAAVDCEPGDKTGELYSARNAARLHMIGKP